MESPGAGLWGDCIQTTGYTSVSSQTRVGVEGVRCPHNHPKRQFTPEQVFSRGLKRQWHQKASLVVPLAIDFRGMRGKLEPIHSCCTCFRSTYPSWPSVVLVIAIQSLCPVRLFATPWTAARQASLSISNSQTLLKLMSIESVIPSNHLILCLPLLLLPSIFPSIRVFSNESVLHIRWPKYWSFSFSISPSNEYSRLISLRIDWFDLALQGTLKSLLQHQNSKASILWCSAFFVVQLLHPYMTTGKTIALTRWTFVSEIMSRQSNVLRE